MKLNKKGFMLAEVVITSSVVAVILVTLYIGINRMTNAYDKRNKYYDIDAQQVAMEVNDLFVRNNFDINSYDNYTILNESNVGSDYASAVNIYENGFDLNINTYLVKNVNGFNNLKSSRSNNLFSDYIDYYINKNDDLDSYSYFIVVELERNDEYCYYTLKVVR